MRIPAFNGKEQKNRGFLLILWKPVLGVDDCTDFTLSWDIFYWQSGT